MSITLATLTKHTHTHTHTQREREREREREIIHECDFNAKDKVTLSSV